MKFAYTCTCCKICTVPCLSQAYFYTLHGPLREVPCLSSGLFLQVTQAHTVDWEIFSIKTFSPTTTNAENWTSEIFCSTSNLINFTPVRFVKGSQRQKLNQEKMKPAKYFTDENFPIYGTKNNHIYKWL